MTRIIVITRTTAYCFLAFRKPHSYRVTQDAERHDFSDVSYIKYLAISQFERTQEMI
jgi:hypothetical protein